MFVKVIVALAVVFVGMGLVVKGVGAHVGSLVRPDIDLSLTQDVTGHAWTPVLKGHPAPGQRLRFGAGQVHSSACKGDLGSYSLHIDHHFGFQPQHACAGGRQVQRLLARVTKAAVSTEGGHQVLVLSSDHRTLLTLRGRG